MVGRQSSARRGAHGSARPTCDAPYQHAWELSFAAGSAVQLQLAAAEHGVVNAAVYSRIVTYRHRHLICRASDISGSVAYAQRHQIHATIHRPVALRAQLR